MASVLQKWGLGAVLTFDSSRAERGMGKATRGVATLRRGFGRLREAGTQLAGSLGILALSLTPIAIGYNLLLAKSSSLASDLEAQKLTMRVLLGDSAKAEQLIAGIREKAASTPFQEGDLIEGSKRLLRLTKENVGANQKLLDVALTMTALNPTKSVTDSVEAILDAAGGGGFERLKEFGLAFKAEDFKALGRPGGEAWAQGVTEAIGSEMQRITRGEDLVGALSQTFGGRLSTLKDNISQTFTGIGEKLNEFLGPALNALTELVKEIKGPVIDGFGIFLDMVDAAWSKYGQPLFEKFQAGLKAVGATGISMASIFAFAFGALATVFVSMAAGLGGVAVVVGSLVSAFTAIAGVISAPLVEGVGLALATIGVSASVLGAILLSMFGAVRNEGEGPFQTLFRIGAFVFGFLVEAFSKARRNFGAFWSGFTQGFGNVGPILERVTAPLRRIWERLSQIFGFIATEGDQPLAFFENIGWFVGTVMLWAFENAAQGLEALFNVFEAVFQILTPFYLAMLPLLFLLGDLISGTATWGDLWGALWTAALGVVLGVVNGIMIAIAGVIEFALRAIEGFLKNIPGIGQFIDMSSVTGGIAKFRGDLSADINKGILGVDLAQAAVDKGKAKEQEVKVDNKVEVDAKFDVKTCIDGEEVGRSLGKGAVRNGEKGSGPRLPADQRGRVLRRGLIVTPLSPAEVL